MSTFGLKYYAEMRSKFKEVYWRAEIAERGYLGEAEEMFFDGSSPLKITWEQQGDDIFVPVKGSTAVVAIKCFENFKYLSLFNADPRRFRVSIYRNAVLFWRGYVVADLYSESFAAPPYTVNINAVDGFSILSNIPYLDDTGANYTGLTSAHTVISRCLDMLELELDIADWIDLYAYYMTPAKSPLKQMYVDMDRFYAVYPEATYRDALELFLRPLAAQMFQSSGAIHIRRAISLYSDSRPLNYYQVGDSLPAGWLITADGKYITTADGQRLTTSVVTREVIESMWEGSMPVSREANLDLLPAMRSININIANSFLPNFQRQLGFYDIANWNNAENSLMASETYQVMYLLANDDTYGNLMMSPVCEVEQTLDSLKIQFTACLSPIIKRSEFITDPLSLNIGFKLVNDETLVDYYLTSEGDWTTTPTYLDVDLSSENEVNVDVSAEGVPFQGTLRCIIKQNYQTSSLNYRPERIEIRNFLIQLEPSEDQETSTAISVDVNDSNNKDITVSLPIGTVPTVPNAELTYSLYLVDADNVPIDIWHTKGKDDYDTLENHIIKCAYKYYQKPGIAITGDVFTGKHVDLNTVVQDDQFQQVALYVNSTELDALTDMYNTELVEMPALLNKYTPEEGDDCVTLAEIQAYITSSARVGNGIALITDDNNLYYCDCVSDSLIHLYEFDSTLEALKVWASNQHITIGYQGGAYVLNTQGKVLRHYADSNATGFASIINNHLLVMINKPSIPDRPTAITKYLLDVDYDKNPRLSTTTVKTLEIDSVKSIAISPYICVVNERADRGHIIPRKYDSRINHRMVFEELDDVTEMLSISDYYECYNDSTSFKVARKLTLTESIEIKDFGRQVEACDQTATKIAYMVDDFVYEWNALDQDEDSYRIINSEGTEQLQNIIYVNGELYIIREHTIYKFIEKWQEQE